MRCIRCGAEAGDGEVICKNCGASLGTQNGAAGNINSQGRIYQNGTGGKGSGQESRNNAGGNSPESGYQNYGGGHNYSGSGAPNNGAGPGQRSLPAFIVGLIGSILGMLGGLCTSMCDFRKYFLRRPDRCDGKFVCSFENCKRQDRLFHNRMV